MRNRHAKEELGFREKLEQRWLNLQNKYADADSIPRDVVENFNRDVRKEEVELVQKRFKEEAEHPRNKGVTPDKGDDRDR